MSWLKKHVTSRIDSGFRKLGLSKRGSKFARSLVTGDIVSLGRAIQRSHKFGQVGKSVMPSMSSSNLVTNALNRVQNALSRSAMRSATRNQTVNSSSSFTRSVDPSDIVSDRLDYRYRRFGDLT